MQKFYIIGMSDDHRQHFAPEVMGIISDGKVFSGGKRHHEIVRSLLPLEAEWIDITVPLDAVFARYMKHPEIVVFASGDPLFFGFANTVRRKLPEAQIVLFPFFNSLQMLAHRMLLPYQDMRTVSLTGRPWDAFDAALIGGERLIGVLTDREKTPARIAARMLKYGYDNYRMTVGEALGNRQEERVRTFSVNEAAQETFGLPNCLILERTAIRPHPFGIPEGDFHLLNGRSKMITKMPIRLLSLSLLSLHEKTSLWDIGFCTGSVSIEAKLQFPSLKVTAFERRPEGLELMTLNCKKFGTPGIEALAGDFLETNTDGLPAPDAVFIGGHGGKMMEIMQKIDRVLLPGGCIVFNSVSAESRELFVEAVERTGRKVTRQIRMAVDAFNPIDVMKAE